MAKQRWNPDLGAFEDDPEDIDRTDPATDTRGSGDPSAQPSGVAGDPAYDANPRDYMVQRDTESWRNSLRAGINNGQGYNFGDVNQAIDEELQGVVRDAANERNAGKDPNEFVNAGIERLKRRGQPSGATDSTQAPPSSGNPSPYAGWLQQPQAQVDGSAALIAELRSQRQADQARQAEERAAMRHILMDRLGQAGAPVSADSPGIKEMIAAQQLAGQRASERQRSQVAARLSADGLADSGASDTTLFGIEQARGEAEQASTADILGKEMQAKRQELLSLLQLAVSSNDAESARAVQMQLAELDANQAQQRITNQNTQFGESLGFQKSSFLDDLGYRLMALQLGANTDAYNAFR